MKICCDDITLRDMTAADIDDYIRWYTTETAWQDWDAPWEWEEEEAFNAEEYRRKQLGKLSKPKDENRIRYHFEFDFMSRHTGSLNTYSIDENCNWTIDSNKLAIGIDIFEQSEWGKGIGGKAFAAFIKYYFSNGYKELFTQTWSGNIRMLRMAERLGFEIYLRDIGMRKVKGQTYDRITMKITVGNLKE